MEIEKILDDLEAWRNEAPERRGIIAITAEPGDDNKVIMSARISVEGKKAVEAITTSIVDVMSTKPAIRKLILFADSILRLKLNNE